MADYTPNLNLEKPLQSEGYDVDIFNANADKIDNFAGQTPARALTADKLTTGAKINGVNFRGDSDITLPIVDVDGETIIKNNNGIISTVINEDIANTSLNNLSIDGNNRLHALKGYLDEGELLTDVEGLADVIKYAHSAFDISKFEVVGSPVITDDGVASNFSNGNYLKIPKVFDFSRPFTIDCKFTTGSTLIERNLFGVRLSGGYAIVAGIWQGALGIIFPNTDGGITQETGIPATRNTLYYYHLEYDGVNFIVEVGTDKNNLTQIVNSTKFNGGTTVITSETFFGLGTSRLGDSPWQGTIDLKEFKITIDGEEVFSGSKLITPQWQNKPFKFDVKSINAQTEETLSMLQLMNKASSLTLNDENDADDMFETIDIERK